MCKLNLCFISIVFPGDYVSKNSILWIPYIYKLDIYFIIFHWCCVSLIIFLWRILIIWNTSAHILLDLWFSSGHFLKDQYFLRYRCFSTYTSPLLESERKISYSNKYYEMCFTCKNDENNFKTKFIFLIKKVSMLISADLIIHIFTYKFMLRINC